MKPLLLLCLAFPSCAGITGAITGQPIPTTSVVRAGSLEAVPFNVASADVALAESDITGKTWGLYDAGYIATKTREAVVSATK